MAVRIYTLAKELNLDSKVLVEICDKAGITGKGSALASLSEEEVERIRGIVAGPKKGEARPAPTAPGNEPARALSRSDYIAPAGAAGGKIPVLRARPARPATKKTAADAAASESPAEETPLEQPVGDQATQLGAPAAEVPSVEMDAADSMAADSMAAESPASVAPVSEAAPSRPSGPLSPAVMSRPMPPPVDFAAPIPPTRSPIPSKVPTLRSARDARTSKLPKAPARPVRTIKLAPLPISKAPKDSKTKKEEPAPQKPDIRLPLDAIRAGKAGTKPLKEHLKKHEEKRKKAAAEQKGRPAGAKPAKAAEEETPAAARERGRRTTRVEGPVEDSEKTLGGREQRQLKRKKSATSRHTKDGAEDDTPSVSARRRTRIRRTGANTAAPRKTNVVLDLPCTVRSFSEAIGVAARDVIRQLMTLGTLANINAELAPETAELLATDLGVEINFHHAVNLEDSLIGQFGGEDTPESLKPRPPIVTFLGHVDHGKTSLLDRILNLNVVSGEKGGITQHIRAYCVEKKNGAISFVDTPGHEAFTEMRARGANVTDIAVLVVAAEDGVMPQTEEAISHARAAGVPIVVALNKIDIPGANPQRAYEQLAANDLLPSEWGGETEVIKTSAITGQGVDELLDTLLTVAELHEYRANPDRPATGTCLEAELHEGRGVVAKLLVQNGTMKVGDVVVCGATYGRVKAMYDTLKPRKRYEAAGPSVPVNVTGLNEAPGAGDRFYVLSDISQARHLAEQRAQQMRERDLAGGRPHVTLETLFERLGQQDDVQTLNIILRADVRGSIEAIRKELTKLLHPEVQIRILQATVGGVTEADVHLADASDAVIIA
ncbi:MAG: translation initiation factor IF-2, partial [Patescibacteria group bacterium]|nr:translation initiation factor IF-2 [Patescibacteria group bacterium]